MRTIARMTIEVIGAVCLLGLLGVIGSVECDTLPIQDAVIVSIFLFGGFVAAVYITYIWDRRDYKDSMDSITVIDSFLYLANGYEITLENGHVTKVEKSKEKDQ